MHEKSTAKSGAQNWTEILVIKSGAVFVFACSTSAALAMAQRTCPGRVKGELQARAEVIPVAVSKLGSKAGPSAGKQGRQVVWWVPHQRVRFGDPTSCRTPNGRLMTLLESPGPHLLLRSHLRPPGIFGDHAARRASLSSQKPMVAKN